MSEENNNEQNVPFLKPSEVPEFLSGDYWYDVDVTPYRLDFSKQYEAPRYTLSWNGIPFAPLGGIHAITGQAGNGKTMTLAQFMAAIICGEFGNLRYELSDFVERPRVLYIDTEMEEANTIAVKNRVMTMCGRSINDQSDDFVVVMLREVPETTLSASKGEVRISSSVNRWRMTLKAIWQYKPTAVFIDGLLDVVSDFNDNKECQEIIYKCMQVASHYGISVWCIVHQNPGGEKLVGHLGSFIERKVTDIFRTKKDKNDKSGDVTFTVKQLKARGRDVEDWQFRVEPVSSWGMPVQLADVQRKDKAEGDDPTEILKWINEANSHYQWPMTRGEIKKKIFSDIGGQSNATKQQIDLTIAINMGYLVESTLKSGNGSYMLQPPDDLPF